MYSVRRLSLQYVSVGRDGPNENFSWTYITVLKTVRSSRDLTERFRMGERDESRNYLKIITKSSCNFLNVKSQLWILITLLVFGIFVRLERRN